MVHSDSFLVRYFLNHTFLEQAFDQLCDAGFRSEHGKFMKICMEICQINENISFQFSAWWVAVVQAPLLQHLPLT